LMFFCLLCISGGVRVGGIGGMGGDMACDTSSRSCGTHGGAEDEAPCTCRSRVFVAHARLQHPLPPPWLRHRHRRILLLPTCLWLLILISAVEGFVPLPGLLHGLRGSRAARAMDMNSGGSSGSRSSAANSSWTSSSPSLLLVKGVGGRDSIRLPARLSACLAVRPRPTVDDTALNSSDAEVGNAGGVLQSSRNSSGSTRSGSEGQHRHREEDDEEDDNDRLDVQGEPTQSGLGGVEAVVLGKIIIDEFVLRRQPEGQVMSTPDTQCPMPNAQCPMPNAQNPLMRRQWVPNHKS
jgi:hypothetical protein